MGGLVWFDKIFQACQGPTSFIAYERGWVIFEYSHVFAVVVLSWRYLNDKSITITVLPSGFWHSI
jgi:hypothetical protein